MTELGRDALRRRQKWFAEQNQFSCGKEMESFADLTPSALLEAAMSERECDGFQGRRSSETSLSLVEMTQQQAAKLPAWQVALIVVTAIAAITAAGIAIWEAFWR
ncbi:MAG: hypothetical protein V3S51_00835 [Dehalococcoidia bacterium]